MDMKTSWGRWSQWLLFLFLVPVGLACAQAPSEVGEKDGKRVPPGINDRFLSADLDVDQWVETFEGESREVFSARHEVVAQCDIQPGQRIADIGAGTGLYTRLFAEKTGEKGWVYAVDISTRFLEHINQESADATNITAVLGQEDSVQLPPASIDLAFICDTYHHFEYPAATMRSIRQALAPSGMLVVIDFERIPGETRQWTMDHVRAGKQTFREEIEAAGFEFVEEKQIAGFEENYFLKFRKK
jgi:ubiquinone/menaquinone biosynthesis C-methylase UbiE